LPFLQLASLHDALNMKLRVVHGLISVVSSEMIEILNKTGGNPNIIIVFGNAESNDEDDED
jgi:hypothetical protein